MNMKKTNKKSLKDFDKKSLILKNSQKIKGGVDGDIITDDVIEL